MEFWSNFWSIIWWFILAFVFIAYLMALFSIITDVFRDRSLSGWDKALWILFLLLVPFITALVYLIFRGNSMADRRDADAQRAAEAANAYIRQAAGKSPADEIEKATALLESGRITSEEFHQIKAKALG
ncbi:Phospholipase_D-nuclease N-terminal [Brevibacterium siliguriense]|uniref:Phospholipase_D-nuclease N-terminal n=1 Tax=Brevibacterium siliguriense TaxID=1136497 RepID=A0A1H1WB72_9MICO|nr:SHOCT domain-containing protein [Brevibacterium siliguriense]SDS94363.1 Phospholipase_D-nuclease N-terminal [Brevibacterium siliguriense]